MKSDQNGHNSYLKQELELQKFIDGKQAASDSFPTGYHHKESKTCKNLVRQSTFTASLSCRLLRSQCGPGQQEIIWQATARICNLLQVKSFTRTAKGSQLALLTDAFTRNHENSVPCQLGLNKKELPAEQVLPRTEQILASCDALNKLAN